MFSLLCVHVFCDSLVFLYSLNFRLPCFPHSSCHDLNFSNFHSNSSHLSLRSSSLLLIPQSSLPLHSFPLYPPLPFLPLLHSSPLSLVSSSSPLLYTLSPIFPSSHLPGDMVADCTVGATLQAFSAPNILRYSALALSMQG